MTEHVVRKLTPMQAWYGQVSQVWPRWKTSQAGQEWLGLSSRQTTDPVNIQRPYRQQNTRSKYGGNHPETVNGVKRSLKVEYANQGPRELVGASKAQSLCVGFVCGHWMRAFLWGRPRVSEDPTGSVFKEDEKLGMWWGNPSEQTHQCGRFRFATNAPLLSKTSQEKNENMFPTHESLQFCCLVIVVVAICCR